jgi:DNA ligase-1
MKFKTWNNIDLKGKWLFTYKIDGVSCINNNGKMMSKDNKPLYNIPNFQGERAEIYCGSFKETIKIVRSYNNRQIKSNEIYVLEPKIDPRLIIKEIIDPVKETIKIELDKANYEGYEGLVLWSEDKKTLYKVKKIKSEDVRILNIIEGKGKNKGKLGAFMTKKGNVGVGFTDEERQKYFSKNLINSYIEVKYMELTEKGKFRHPRFYRLREDK